MDQERALRLLWGQVDAVENWNARRLAGEVMPALMNVNLAGAKLTDIDLSGLDLTGANLAGACLESADLRGTNLSYATLCGTTLSLADLSNANLSGADLRGAGLSNATLTMAVMRSADLRGADLTEADLCPVDLSKADLRGALLSGADLTGLSDLSGANFSACDMAYVDLSDAGLSGAILRCADLTDADLSRASLIGADMTQAIVDRIRARDAQIFDLVGEPKRPSEIWFDSDGDSRLSGDQTSDYFRLSRASWCAVDSARFLQSLAPASALAVEVGKALASARREIDRQLADRPEDHHDAVLAIARLRAEFESATPAGICVSRDIGILESDSPEIARRLRTCVPIARVLQRPWSA